MSQPIRRVPTEKLQRRAQSLMGVEQSMRAGTKGRRHARRALERIRAELLRRHKEGR